MKLKELKNICFYKLCTCEEALDVVFMDFGEVVMGTPLCPICKTNYVYEEEQEIWDTELWRG